jgi:hypothetical protein
VTNDVLSALDGLMQKPKVVLFFVANSFSIERGCELASLKGEW